MCCRPCPKGRDTLCLKFGSNTNMINADIDCAQCYGRVQSEGHLRAEQEVRPPEATRRQVRQPLQEDLPEGTAKGWTPTAETLSW